MSKKKPPDEPRGKLLRIDVSFEDAVKAALETKPPTKPKKDPQKS